MAHVGKARGVDPRVSYASRFDFVTCTVSPPVDSKAVSNMRKSGSPHETNKTCREIGNRIEFERTNGKTKSHSSTSRTNVG